MPRNDSECCFICLKGLSTPGLGRQTLSCGHVMHEQCLAKMRSRNISARCPVCHRADDDLMSVEELVGRARFHFHQGGYADGAALLSQALDLQPDHGLANFEMGQAFYSGLGVDKDVVRAEQLYEKAWDKGCLQAANQLGMLYEQRGNTMRAQQLYKEAQSGSCPEDVAELATFHLGQGNLAEAEQLYESARSRGLPNHNATIQLASLHEQKGDINKAEQLYEEAWRGGYVDGAVGLAILNMQRGRVDTAEQLLEEAQRGGSRDAADMLAILYKDQANMAKAVQLSAKARHQGSASATYNLGVQHHSQGDIAKAEELWEEAWNGGSEEAVLALGHMHMQRCNIAMVKQLFEDAWRRGHGEVAVKIITLLAECGHAEDTLGIRSSLHRQQGNSVTRHRCPEQVGCGANSEQQRVPIELFESRLQFAIGDFVYIHHLSGPHAMYLNGRIGRVVKHSQDTGRFGIAVAGIIGLKAVRPDNLTLKVSIEWLVRELGATKIGMQDVGEVHTQASDAIFRNALDEGPRVILLKFSRRPKALRSLLLEAPELQICRDALQAHDMPCELPCMAKVFVSPEDYFPALEAIRLQGVSLSAQYVVVDVDLEAVILDIVKPLRFRPHSVHSIGAATVPLAFPEALLQSGMDIDISRTFIHIKLPSSLQPTTDSGSIRTASTTDSNARKGRNHRRGRKSR